MKDHVQQGIADLQGPVVLDEPELAELVHKNAPPRFDTLMLLVALMGLVGLVMMIAVSILISHFNAAP
jgi:hypothetical protein